MWPAPAYGFANSDLGKAAESSIPRQVGANRCSEYRGLSIEDSGSPNQLEITSGQGLASLHSLARGGGRRHHLPVVSFNTNAMPELKIKQTPDAIVVVDVTSAVLIE